MQESDSFALSLRAVSLLASGKSGAEHLAIKADFHLLFF